MDPFRKNGTLKEKHDNTSWLGPKDIAEEEHSI